MQARHPYQILNPEEMIEGQRSDLIPNWQKDWDFSVLTNTREQNERNSNRWEKL